MGNYYDSMAGMKKAYVNMRNGQLLKWTGITLFVDIGMYAIGTILSVLITLSAAGSIEALLANNNPSPLGQVVSQIFGLISALFGLYLVPRVLRAAMGANNMKVGPNAPGVVDWAFFSIRQAFINLACWYDKKLAIPLVGLAVALVLIIITVFAGANSALGTILPILAMLIIIVAGIGYVIGYTIHSMRTTFSNYFYARDNKDGSACIRQSYDLVNGQTFEVFLAHFALILPLIMLFVAAIIVFIALALIPIVGILVDAVLFLVLLVLFSSFSAAYAADVFAYYEKVGPVVGKTAVANKK